MVYEDTSSQQANQKLVGNEPSIVGSAPSQNNPATAPIQKFNQANQVRQQSDVDPNQQKQGSGAFTNIRKYLDVNRNAAQQLGGKIQGKIGQQASDIRAGIEKSQEQFKTGASQVADIGQTGEVTGLRGASDVISQIKADPTKLVQNQEQLQQFRNLQTGAISTPEKTLTGTEVKPLDELAKATQTEQGRLGLLKSTVRSPSQTYTSGQQSLDQLFLQAAPKVGDQLQKYAGEQLSQTSRTLNPALEQQNKIREQIEQAKVKTQEDIQNTLGGFEFDEKGQLKTSTGELGNLYKNIYDARQNAINQQQTDLQRIQDAVKQGNISPEVAKVLGLQANQRLFNLDIKPYKDQLALGDIDITDADIANAEQEARIKALSTLANRNIDLGQEEGTIGPRFTGGDSIATNLATRQKEFETAFNAFKPESSQYTYETQTPEINNLRLMAGLISDDGDTSLRNMNLIDQLRPRYDKFLQTMNDPSVSAQEQQQAYNDYLESLNVAQQAAKYQAEENNRLSTNVNRERYFNNRLQQLRDLNKYDPFRRVQSEQQDINLNQFRGNS